MRGDLVIAVHQLDGDQVDKTERAVLIALAIHTNKDTGACYPSIDTLVARTGWSRSSVVDAISRLKKRALIKVKRSRYHQQYELTLPRSPAGGTLEDENPGPRSPAGGIQSASGRHPEVQPAASRVPAGGTKVVSEAGSEVVTEAVASIATHAPRPRRPPGGWNPEASYAAKVDALLDAPSGELFITKEGQVNVRLLAQSINQRDGMPAHVTDKQMATAERCVQYRSRRKAAEASL